MSEPQCKRSKMSSSLEQLKALTTVVADTGDFEGKPFFLGVSRYLVIRTIIGIAVISGNYSVVIMFICVKT